MEPPPGVCRGARNGFDGSATDTLRRNQSHLTYRAQSAAEWIPPPLASAALACQDQSALLILKGNSVCYFAPFNQLKMDKSDVLRPTNVVPLQL